ARSPLPYLTDRSSIWIPLYSTLASLAAFFFLLRSARRVLNSFTFKPRSGIVSPTNDDKLSERPTPPGRFKDALAPTSVSKPRSPSFFWRESVLESGRLFPTFSFCP